MRRLTHDFGLAWCPNVFRDAQFYWTILAGVGLCVALGLVRGGPSSSGEECISLRALNFAVWAPLWEELLFRGALQGWLRSAAWALRSWKGLTAANLVVSVLFALAHLFHQAPLPAGLVFVPSLLFGYFRDRHESVYPAVGLHALYNAGYLFAAGLPGG